MGEAKRRKAFRQAGGLDTEERGVKNTPPAESPHVKLWITERARDLFEGLGFLKPRRRIP